MDEIVTLQIKVLIVDDDKVLASILKDLISDRDMVIDLCHDGMAAIDRIQKNNYDLILVDLIMPKLGGLDVLKFAKRVNPDVIVTIVTGYASLETAITAVKEGAYDYIRKPCKLDEIKIVMKNAVDKIKLNRENKELIRRLQDAYHELMVLKKEKGQDNKKASINFYSSGMPNLHYSHKPDFPSDNYIDKLNALSSLKDSGVLTPGEFGAFKRHLLKEVRQAG